MKLLIFVTSLLLPYSIIGYCQSINSEELILNFTQIDSTLYSRIKRVSDTTYVSIQFPENYDSSGRYPIICFLKGGYGGTGKEAKNLVEIFGKQSIIINIPLFKGIIKKLNRDSSSSTENIFINDKDGEAIWSNYSLILDTVSKIIPKYDKENSFLCGLSNGAHTIAVLINQENGEIFNYFDNFILISGGHSLQNYNSLKGKDILFIQGELEGNWLKSKYKSTKKNRAKADYYEMKNTGHSFPSEYYYIVSNWINKKYK